MAEHMDHEICGQCVREIAQLDNDLERNFSMSGSAEESPITDTKRRVGTSRLE
ncbi:hypothetical protein TRAPUB_12688 [Trametes pubescens]|uniref:Uncharacterized protein n=1 Tax=Trametes pubescens TaxID=154538 RepID=A0A1M2VT82_TRAPU|nr:hypothetical protein TRAPUB_12688 [Trametes pubescens]